MVTKDRSASNASYGCETWGRDSRLGDVGPKVNALDATAGEGRRKKDIVASFIY